MADSHSSNTISLSGAIVDHSEAQPASNSKVVHWMNRQRVTQSQSTSKSPSSKLKPHWSWRTGITSTSCSMSAGSMGMPITGIPSPILFLWCTLLWSRGVWMLNIRPVSLSCSIFIFRFRWINWRIPTETLGTLQTIINLSWRQGDNDIEKISRWIRCLFQLALTFDESISIKCLDQANKLADGLHGVCFPPPLPFSSSFSLRYLILHLVTLPLPPNRTRMACNHRF